MFCPNCAEKNSPSQRFCRVCGLNLEKTAESLIDQKRLDGNTNTLAQGEKFLQRFGSVTFGGLGALGLFGIGYLLYQIFIKMVLAGPAANVIIGILAMAFIIFAVAGLIYVIGNEVIKEKKKKIAFAADDNELSGGVNTGKLLDQGTLQPVASVTEHTTDLLYDKARTSRLDR